MTLYDNIKTLRENLKMSQDELAKKVGYKDRTSIAKIESGKVDLSQSKIFAFANALNTTPEELMGLKYYEDREVSEYAQAVKDNPNLRLLFDASKDMSKDDIDFVLNTIEMLKKREAKEYGHVIVKELDKTALLTKNTELKELTFKEFADMFLEIKKAHITHSTLVMYNHAICAYRSIHDMKLSDIKPLHIQNVVNKMVTSPTTITTYYKVVSRIFYIAINPYKIISDNPCTGVRLPRVERKSMIHTISDEELNQFAKFMREKYPQAYYFLQIARYTGMRFSEVYGLTWNDISLENHQIHINKQLSFRKGVITFEKTKTANSVRILPIPPILENILIEYKSHELEFEHDLVLNPYKKNGVKWQINTYLKRFGDNLSAHNLRHTYATKLLANGLDVKTVSSLLGDTPQMVMKTYVHYNDEMKAAASNAVANIFK